jgi:peptidoglycan hydrolase-like protein with peptidoglycan-binding domain
MTPCDQEEPFSLLEFAVGTVAVVAVAVIAFLGIAASRQPHQSPAVLSKVNPSAVTVANTSTKVREWRPDAAFAAMERTPSERQPKVIPTTLHQSESPAANFAARKPGSADPGRTKARLMSIFFDEADLAAPVRLVSLEIAGLPPPLIGPPDLMQIKDTMSVQLLKPVRVVATVAAGTGGAPQRSDEAAALSPPEAVKEPSTRADIMWIQAKLLDLGYYAGNVNGIWGPASRSALRDFKGVNGLQNDDTWDKETEELLSSKQSIRASTAEVPQRTAEAAAPPPAEARKDPSTRADIMWIQTKLLDLGYYAGNVNGIWGPASRSALRDFKGVNGLQDDDTWDKETEELLSSKQSIRASTAEVRQRAAEAAAPSPAEARKDPSNRADAMWIQTKLHDLGYYPGNANGIFGPATHSALHDFKIMNGLQDDDKWDQDSERLLLSKQSIRASSTFMGSWAKDTGACQSAQGSAPLVIRSRGAEAVAGKCDFRSVKREAATTWRVQAACSADKQEWTANISLKLTGSSLNWSSERGNETYVRCPNS